MNINRTEALAAISQNPGTKQEKNSNTVFADLLRAQQQAQPAAQSVRAVTATSPVAAAAQKPATSASVAEPEASSEKSAAQEFRDYMAMSDAEKNARGDTERNGADGRGIRTAATGRTAGHRTENCRAAEAGNRRQ